MHLNFKVVLQWLGLLLGLGSVKVQYIDEAMVEELLGKFYVPNGIWIEKAVYLPTLGVLQIVALAPSANYSPNALHVTKEQFVRVQTQAGVLLALLSDSVPKRVKDASAQEFSDNLYYREERTRWRRLVRSDDPFVCQFRIAVRDIRGNTAFTINMSDGPFEGEIKAVYVPEHSTAEAEEGLESCCYTIWQAIVNHIISKVAFSLARKRLAPTCQETAWS